jgi:hypothetical protein
MHRLLAPRLALFIAPRLTIPLALCALAHPAGAQADSARAALLPRSLAAVHITGAAPVIDGRLDDAVWRHAPVARDFVQSGPHPGAPAVWRTRARVAYDDRALYVAMRMFDPHPDSIVAPVPRRDDETVSDWAFAEIDSRHDHRTGFSFGLNPRGVQADGAWSNDVAYDGSWDGVWEGAARIDSAGWTAEFRIPLSQLPYTVPDDGTAEWGINFYRHVARGAESSDWSPRLPSFSGVISYFNTLTGLAIPSSGHAVEITPYVAYTATRAPTVPGHPLGATNDSRPTAGADLSYRLSPGVTITGTIHPDFGQVEADPSEINLTTFESLFTERRPFFVAGAERFQFDMGLPFHTRDDAFDTEQPFYSRRIGRAPLGVVPAGARASDVPSSTNILGAAKLAGRTANGWSFGALSAITAPADARIADSTGAVASVRLQPRTHYGVARMSREFDTGRSAIGAIVTGVTRVGHDSAFDVVAPHDAVAVGVDGRHRFGRGAYEVSGFALGSRISGSARGLAAVLHGPGHFAQRPGAAYLHDDTTRTSATGGVAQLRLARVGGEHWRWSLSAHAITPRFDVNAIGFQHNADWLLTTGSLMYHEYHPRWLHSWSVGLDEIGVGWDFGGERRAALASVSASAALPNYWTVTLGARHELSALSTEILRGGPALLLPPRTSVSAAITSDSRSTTSLSLSANGWTEPATHGSAFTLAPSLVMRVSDRARFAVGPKWSHTVNGWQYVGRVTALGAPREILARLRQETASLTARAIYAFSPGLTLELYAQPFVSAGRYDAFKRVVAPRASRAEQRVAPFAPEQMTYDAATRRYAVDVNGDGASDASFADPAFNAKELNANAVLRWQFRPGSTLFVVWSQQRSAQVVDGSFALSRDAGRLFRVPATNTLLVKLSYWLSSR